MNTICPHNDELLDLISVMRESFENSSQTKRPAAVVCVLAAIILKTARE
jgi:hypothetical protein